MNESAVRRRPLVSYTRTEVAQLLRLRRRRRCVPLSGGWVLHDEACGTPAEDLEWCRVRFELSSVPASLHCPQQLINRMLATLPAAVDASPDLVPLVLELTLEKLLDELEAAAGVSVTVVAAAPAMAALRPGARMLTLEAFERRWPIVLDMPAEYLDALLRIWPSMKTPADTLSLPMVLRLGTTELSLELLRSLRTDDVVLLENRAGKGGGVLVVSEHLLASAEWNGGRWMLRGVPTATHPKKEAWLASSSTARGMAEDNAAQEDDIPVKLCFDLGSVDLPLGELRQLGVGSVLELPAPVDAPIRLTVGGRGIGIGELVDVEGRAGVRILRIFGHG